MLNISDISVYPNIIAEDIIPDFNVSLFCESTQS